jgi:capsular exopolysaccharide synthesis family protein
VFAPKRAPKHASKRNEQSIKLITEKDMSFAYVEAYKALRTNLNFFAAASEARAIVITSTQPEEGKSSVAINLALTLAESGKTVALLDCDLRKPMLHRYLQLGSDGEGLADVLAGEVPVEKAMRKLAFGDVHVLPAGSPQPNPSELLGSGQTEAILRKLRASYDYVILDAPPLAIVTDAAILGHSADGVLFVVRAHRTSADAARAAIRTLRQIDVKVLGAVLTHCDAPKARKCVSYAESYRYDAGNRECNRERDRNK